MREVAPVEGVNDDDDNDNADDDDDDDDGVEYGLSPCRSRALSALEPFGLEVHAILLWHHLRNNEFILLSRRQG